MRAYRAITAIAAGSLAIAGLAACSSGHASSSKSSGGKSVGSGVLNIGMPNATQTDNNNPYLGTSAGASLGYRWMIYEPLAMSNFAQPAATPKPWLATKWTWANNYKTLTLTVRQGVKFSDGSPMTAEDVAYSFNILKKYTALNYNAINVDTATASGDTVTVTFTNSQFVTQQKVLQTFVVPEKIWSAMANPATDAVKNPIGTGPYTLKSFTPQSVVLTARSGYWGTQTAVKQLNYTSYSTNDTQTTALATDQSEWTYTFIPNAQQVFVAKDPAHNHLYFPPNLSADGLWINTTVKPFDDAKLRQAMSMVINRQDIFTQGESGYFKPLVSNVTGLPTPAGNPFIIAQYKNQNASVDVAGAKKLLTDSGYTYASDGTLKDKTGKPVTITLTDPAGWSDYQTDLAIIASNFQQIGIKATIDKANENAWTSNIAKGNFQAAMHWTNGGATPYDFYQNIMGTGDQLKPIGTEANSGNYGRFNDPAAQTALTQYSNAADDATRQKALATLEQIMVNEVPMIPTSAGNVGAEYSTKHWVGWPDTSNEYNGAQPTIQAALDVVLHLKPAS